MILKINNEFKEFPNGTSILEILEKEDILEPVAVEVIVNGKRIDFENFEKIKLKDGDELEYIYLFASG